MLWDINAMTDFICQFMETEISDAPFNNFQIRLSINGICERGKQWVTAQWTVREITAKRIQPSVICFISVF